MKVLSLYDGMSCGMIAFKELGIEVESYDAYEIDKYAIQVSTHNFPEIKHHGDVFKGDFTQYEGVDWVIGGSPCTYWSIAQKNNRETEASGLGWELFCQYVRAIKEAKPKYFLYENNKSMSKEIRASIDEAFGFEAVLINSALVSAQNRQRLYWVGRRNEDGTYSKVNVEQPEDRGILLKDVLDSAVAWQDKSYCITASYNGAVIWNTLERGQRTMVAEPINTTVDGKARTIRATCYKDGIRNIVGNEVDRKTGVAKPIRIGCMPSPDGAIKNSQEMRLYSVDGKAVNQTANGGGMGAKTGLYAVPIEVTEELTPYVENKIPEIVEKYGYLPEHFNAYNKAEINEKTPTMTACVNRQSNSAQVMSVLKADGKTYPIYEVKDGKITIKDKQYPIKLADGYYIIRKLTVSECKRLQTVPEWYDFSVISNSRAYKCLGNGWTVEVIKHLIVSALNQN